MPPKRKCPPNGPPKGPPKRKSLDPNVPVPEVYTPILPEEYTPLERHEYDAKSLLPQQPTSPIECFSYFFDLKIWEVLRDGTNTYQTSKHSGSSERGWEPVDVRDLKIWIGLVIYMGIVGCPSVEDYWEEITRQKPMDAMGLSRFQQIQRYIHISLPVTALAPALPASPAWHEKLEPVASMLANSFRSAYMPSSSCSIDEMMVRFTGRSKHSLRMPNKSINEEYKIYAICDHGYTYGFEFYSRVDGPSGTIGMLPLPSAASAANATAASDATMPPPMPPPISRDLTPTSIICLRLAKLLPYHKCQYSIYFDSFFSNTALFATLRELGIGACGTARKAQLPIELQAYDDKSKDFERGDLASVPRDNVLCARWQDNAGGFLMTTIHDFNDGVVTNRKRPKKSIPAVRQVFGTDVRKLLTIPLMNMGGFDQLRPYYYTELASRHSWLPHFYWLLDTTLVNSYILYRVYNPSVLHKQFRLEVAEALWSTMPVA